MRLFTAVELPAPTRANVALFEERLLTGVPHLSRVPPENLHVTVHFLGSVPEEQVPSIVDALDDALAGVTGDTTPGAVTVRGVGAFPNVQRPRVVWVGIDDPDGVLTRLHAAVTAALGPLALNPLGYPAEARPYHPHVSIARMRGQRSSRDAHRSAASQRALKQLLAAARQSVPVMGNVPVDHLTVFRSTFEKNESPGSGEPRTRGGPRYERIARIPLRRLRKGRPEKET